MIPVSSLICWRVTWLREGGYLTSHRAAAYDSTQVYQIDHDKLRTPEGGNPIPEVSNLQTSEPAKVRTSSSKNVRTTSTVVEEVTQSVEAETHPARVITNDWSPRPAFVRNLRALFPDFTLEMLRSSCQRFVDFHIARQDTSRSWEAAFRMWVGQDYERWLEQHKGGTDFLGVPHHQRPAPAGAQPGDPDYVDPEELAEAAAIEARKRQRKTPEV